MAQKEFEVLRKQAEGRIISTFRAQMAMQEGLPDDKRVAPYAIMADIADREGYTVMGVRTMLIRKGEYVPEKKRRRRKKK